MYGWIGITITINYALTHLKRPYTICNVSGNNICYSISRISQFLKKNVQKTIQQKQKMHTENQIIYKNPVISSQKKERKKRQAQTKASNTKRFIGVDGSFMEKSSTFIIQTAILQLFHSSTVSF